MKKALLSFFTLSLIVGFTACTKPDIKPIEDLPTSATLIRNIDYYIKGTRKDTVYTHADQIITGAGYSFKSIRDRETNTFYLSINAGPHVAHTYGENVIFAIDKANLKPGFVGVYSTSPQAVYPLYDVLYAYSYKTDNGERSNLHNLRMGLPLDTELKIDRYDAVRKTISGSYSISVRLDTDPLKLSPELEADDKCNLTVSGTFSNVTIKQD